MPYNWIKYKKKQKKNDAFLLFCIGHLVNHTASFPVLLST